jgi:hypothetical protein
VADETRTGIENFTGAYHTVVFDQDRADRGLPPWTSTLDGQSTSATTRSPRRCTVADLTIPREAVDAAARQIHTGFDKAAPIEQHNAREAAMAALNAAAPLIVAAELERQIAVAVEYGKNCPCPGADEPGVNCINRFHFEAARVIKRVRIRLAELRAQT